MMGLCTIEKVVYIRHQLPCQYCRKENRQSFGGQTFSYKIMPGDKQLRVEDLQTGRVDYIAIAGCPKCARPLGGGTLR